MLTRRKLLQGFAAGAASAAGLGALGDHTTDALEVVRQNLPLERWDADGFVVALLTDTHVNLRTSVERARRACRLAIAEKPDLIVLAGDYITTSADWALTHIRDSLEPLADAPCPCVAVMGNHDYWTHEPRKILNALGRSPARLLRNELLEVQGVQVAGIDDALVNRHRPDVLAGKSLSKSLLAVLHEPDYVEEMPTHVSLQLSGHSHGGQICLPFGRPIHTPKGARRYVSGFYAQARVPLYVSRGVGTIGPNLRLFCRPEVSILTLRSA